jgi:hypothetical protein
MVSSSWCGESTNAPPGSKERVAVRPAALCAHPHTAPIGGRVIRGLRRVTMSGTSSTSLAHPTRPPPVQRLQVRPLASTPPESARNPVGPHGGGSAAVVSRRVIQRAVQPMRAGHGTLSPALSRKNACRPHLAFC